MVEIDLGGTQVAAEKGRMGGEDGRHFDVPFAHEDEAKRGVPSLWKGFLRTLEETKTEIFSCEHFSKIVPFVEMCNVLMFWSLIDHFFQKPCDLITKDQGIISFTIVAIRRKPFGASKFCVFVHL